MPINIDIQGLQWRDALESILRKNSLWYSEYETYIQISSATPTETGGTERVMVGAGVSGPWERAPPTSTAKWPASGAGKSRSRPSSSKSA